MIPIDDYKRIVYQLEKDAKVFEKCEDIKIKARAIRMKECVKALKDDLKHNGH